MYWTDAFLDSSHKISEGELQSSLADIFNDESFRSLINRIYPALDANKNQLPMAIGSICQFLTQQTYGEYFKDCNFYSYKNFSSSLDIVSASSAVIYAANKSSVWGDGVSVDDVNKIKEISTRITDLLDNTKDCKLKKIISNELPRKGVFIA